jgi:hypothetical protein
MQRARSVLLILFLLAGSLSPPECWAQTPGNGTSDDAGQEFYLEQNYPNPVNPETWIPFYLEDSLFESGDSVVVTLRIFNILRQVVAIPEAVDHPRGRSARVIELPYRDAGRKVAYWDGKDTAGRRVPSGVYYCQLVVNDEPRTRKMIVLNPRRRRGIIPWFGKEKDRPGS